MIHDSTGQAEQTTGNLKLGCYGWQHPRWQGAYYPDDLPADWQLGYYANDFSCVLVPADYWQQDVDMDDWLDAVHESFCFYLEWPQDIKCQQKVLQAGEVLKPHLGGLLLDKTTGDADVSRLPVMHGKPIWRPGVESSLSVGLVDSIKGIDLQQQRSWLEAFDRASHHQARALFVMDANVDHKQLTDMQKLAEMLGL